MRLIERIVIQGANLHRQIESYNALSERQQKIEQKGHEARVEKFEALVDDFLELRTIKTLAEAKALFEGLSGVADPDPEDGGLGQDLSQIVDDILEEPAPAPVVKKKKKK